MKIKLQSIYFMRIFTLSLMVISWTISVFCQTPSLPPINMEEKHEEMKMKRGARKTKGVTKVKMPKIIREDQQEINVHVENK